MELLWQVELPRLAKEVQPLLGLFYNGVYVIVPLQFLGNGGASTSFSNDVMTTDVRATGFLSVSPVILYFFWMGMMVNRLKHEGTLCSSSDLLKIFVKMWASWSAQDFRQAGVPQSGPGTFFLFCLRKTWHTSSLLIWIAGVGERGVAGGVNGCVERCPERVWDVFQTCNRTHSVCQLFILHSAGGMVSCCCLSLSDLSTLMLSHWKIIGSLTYRNNSSLPLWSSSPVCIWPVYTRFYPPSCKLHLYTTFHWCKSMSRRHAISPLILHHDLLLSAGSSADVMHCPVLHHSAKFPWNTEQQSLKNPY